MNLFNKMLTNKTPHPHHVECTAHTSCEPIGEDRNFIVLLAEMGEDCELCLHAFTYINRLRRCAGKNNKHLNIVVGIYLFMHKHIYIYILKYV